jgi:predicted esterase
MHYTGASRANAITESSIHNVLWRDLPAAHSILENYMEEIRGVEECKGSCLDTRSAWLGCLSERF